MPSDLSQTLTNFGGAVSDLFGARGATASASSYNTAASIAEQNAQLTQEATAIKETQASRQIYQTVGAQQAEVGGAGFAESGSALDLMRSSVSQGALTKAVLANQGAITENAYAEQAGMFRGMASSAGSSSTAQTVGALLQGAGGLISGYNTVSKFFGSGTAAAGASGALDLSTTDIAGGIVSNTTGAAAGGSASTLGIADTTLGTIGTAAAGGIAGFEVAKAAGANKWWSAAGGIAGAIATVALCFITTAITKSLGKPDDCDELQTLRRFRDTWLIEHHPGDIEEYYEIAPGIVRAIEAKPDAAQIWASLYVDYIEPAVSAINRREFNSAYELYRGMVRQAEGMI